MYKENAVPNAMSDAELDWLTAETDRINSEPPVSLDDLLAEIERQEKQSNSHTKPTSPGGRVSISSGLPSSPSEKISIRMPVDMMAALRREAKRLGVPYQTLLKMTLRPLTARW